MEDSMRKRLEITAQRFEDLNRDLMNENVTKDINRFRELSKEHANLEPIVEKYKEFLKCEKDNEEAILLSGDSDSDLSEMGKSEHKRLIAEMEKINDEIRVLLIPKDPDDDKNIVVEIRGAVGGDEANIFAGDLFRMYMG